MFIDTLTNKEGIMCKRILITGAGSYIGTNVEHWLGQYPQRYTVNTLDMVGVELESVRFKGYDTVLHVAGIAHQKETSKNAHLYYEINEKLAVEVAEKAKRDGVKQFIVLSSMSVYGMETGMITKDTPPQPKTHYGRSKYNADIKIGKLTDDKFKVVIVRPPMVYGRGCKGNYQLLRKFALKVPVFPAFDNQRSMIFIENLAEFIKDTIDGEFSGVFLPQDKEYVKTTEMVKGIADGNGKRIYLTKIFNPFIRLGMKLGINILNKIFGDLYYDKTECVGAKSFDQIIEYIERDKL